MEHLTNFSPLYQQIIQSIKQKILSGEYATGEKLPAIRELAIQYSVTPNTVQRALQFLEQERLIYTERTNGKYVTLDTAEIDRLRMENLRSVVHAVLMELRCCRYTEEDIRSCFEEEMRENGS